jgi:hypothetical protein
MSSPRRRPLPITTCGARVTASSTSSGQQPGRPTGVMPPYSIPVSATAVSIGAKEARRAPTCLRTVLLTSTRVCAGARQATSVVPPPRFAATTTQFADASTGTP